MATFYAQYPASSGVTTGPVTVQGEGTAGTPTGGVLTVQGDPAGTPIPVTGSISATNPSVGPTGSAVPADATYLGGINGGNLVGVAVDSSGHLIPAVVSDTTATGTITSTQNVSIATAGYATVGVQVTGTFTGTIFVEWSPDGTNWYNTTYASIQTGALALTFTAAGAGTIQCSGAANVRLRGGSVATGTATVYLRANSTSAQLMIDNPLPTGTNTIGAVNQAGNWSTRTQDGSGNAITSTGSALDVNLKTSSVTALASNVAQFGGSNVVTGTGTGGAGIPRVTVSSDSVVGLGAGSAVIGHVINDAGSAIIGKVGIDQTTPGTTNGVQVNAALPAGTNSIGSVIPNATTAATWQAEGAVAFGSVTNAYATILTPSASTKIVMLRNNTNAAISFSFDAGTTTNFTLDAGDQVAIDYVANGLLSATTAIQIKYAVGAPTSGSVRVNACH